MKDYLHCVAINCIPVRMRPIKNYTNTETHNEPIDRYVAHYAKLCFDRDKGMKGM